MIRSYCKKQRPSFLADVILVSPLHEYQNSSLFPLTEQFEFKVGNIVTGAFTPVLAKHSKHFSLVDVLSIGIDRIQRNFEPMKKQVGSWKATRIPDEAAKLVIYRAFVQGS
jgi:hypothetical protein